ncbi:MAG: hypothetical protein ACLRSW_00245 [Christensenellaceae bacterium]
MNEKKLYKVTITDENGKVVHEVESDCIIAAISDPSKGSKEQSAIHGVYMTNCLVLRYNTLSSADTVKRRQSPNPALSNMLAMDSLERIAQKHGVKLGEDEDDGEGSRGYLTF